MSTEQNQSSSSIQQSIYTEEELNVMSKARNTRLLMIDKMTQGGSTMPEKVGEIRVLNEVLTAAEKSAHDSATNRLKYQSGANKDAILQTVIATLKAVNKVKLDTPDVDIEIRSDLKEIDYVDGELDIDPSKLIIEDFTELQQL